MPAVEILDVSRFDQNSEQLWGYWIDQPAAGEHFEGYILPVSGWALGREVPVVAIELVYQGLLLRSTHCGLLRLDVARQYPDVSGADHCGFSTAVSVLGMAPEFKLLLQAVFQDGRKFPLGFLRGRREAFTPVFRPKASDVQGQPG
jgi:hypothetical protein